MRATRTRWRASLAVVAMIGLPMALPAVVLQGITHFTLTGAGDPVRYQHMLWIMGAPEVTALVFSGWLLLLGPWAIGVWGVRGARGLRLKIGWEPYARYLVVGLCAGSVTLHLSGAWRATAPLAGRIAGLSVVWVGLCLLLAVAAQVLSLMLASALSAMELGPSTLHLALRLGAPGVVSGAAAILIALASISLFWSVAERAPAQP